MGCRAHFSYLSDVILPEIEGDLKRKKTLPRLGTGTPCLPADSHACRPRPPAVEIGMRRARAAFVLVLVLAGCGSPPPPGPPAVPPESGATTPPVVGRPVTPPAASESPASVAPASAPQSTAAPAEPLVAIPAGAVYACVVDSAGERQVIAIEFVPKVAALCAQNPEMGPCQYEREICRHSGGRVFAADGKEITKATEAEYDRRVLRARISN